jgi:hypothetical protein
MGWSLSHQILEPFSSAPPTPTTLARRPATSPPTTVPRRKRAAHHLTSLSAGRCSASSSGRSARDDVPPSTKRQPLRSRALSTVASPALLGPCGCGQFGAQTYPNFPPEITPDSSWTPFLSLPGLVTAYVVWVCLTYCSVADTWVEPACQQPNRPVRQAIRFRVIQPRPSLPRRM